MKIEIKSKVLKDALSKVSAATSGHMPILACVKMFCLDGKVTLTSTNLDVVAIETVEANVLKEGTIAIDPSKIIGLLDASDTVVKIEADNRGKSYAANITIGKFHKKVKCLPVSDLPKYMAPKPISGPVMIDGGILVNGMDSVRGSAGKLDNVLNGVNFDFGDEGTLKLAATDKNNISTRDIEIKGSLKGFTLPRGSVDIIAKAVDQADEVSIDRDESCVRFKWKSGEVRSKVHSSPYPLLISITSKSRAPDVTWVKVDRADIVKPLGWVSDIHKYNHVSVEIKSGKLILSSESEGEDAEDIIAVGEGSMDKVKVNGHRVIAGIKAAPSQELEMACVPPMLAIRTKDASWYFLIAFSEAQQPKK